MAKMSTKSVLDDAAQVELARTLIELDARLQVLESETKLSRERLIRLYKEIKKKSPPKGMLPFSTEWFVSWQANVHASLFMNLYQTLIKTTSLSDSNALISAFKLYREKIAVLEAPEVLSMTRAWRLVKFFDAGMMTTTACTRCTGKFVLHTYDLTNNYVCGLCNLPSRAGKTQHYMAKKSFMNDEVAQPA